MLFRSVVLSNDDKENECPPSLNYEVPSEDLGCFEVPSSSGDEVYDLGSENDDGCTVLSPEPVPRQTYPLTPIDNGHTWSRFRGSACQPFHSSERTCPLPNFTWASEKSVWERMCAQDAASVERRHADMFSQHPLLQPRMRSVLLDWLIEVCEVYRLHRETYYLAMDFLDRYLALTEDLPKTQLQLIGITCLFIAAKMEEIYPPKIGEFAYVTDGACTESDILSKELAIMKCLEWRLSPLTVNYWLNTYMQLVSSHRRAVARQQRSAAREKLARRVSRSSLGGLYSSPHPEVQTAHEENLGSSFVYPQFSGLSFSETAQLLDLCTLDAGCLQFSYSVLATAALHHTVSREIALRFSGMQWQDIQSCVRWMKPYAIILAKEGPLQANTCVSQNSSSSHCSGLNKAVPNIVVDDSHNIQTHAVNLDMLEQAQAYNRKLIEEEEVKALGLLTPPSSGCKPLVSSHGSAFT